MNEESKLMVWTLQTPSLVPASCLHHTLLQIPGIFHYTRTYRPNNHFFRNTLHKTYSYPSFWFNTHDNWCLQRGCCTSSCFHRAFSLTELRSNTLLEYRRKQSHTHCHSYPNVLTRVRRQEITLFYYSMLDLDNLTFFGRSELFPSNLVNDLVADRHESFLVLEKSTGGWNDVVVCEVFLQGKRRNTGQ